jgi:hypothetical protein
MFAMLESLLKPMPNVVLPRYANQVVGKIKKGMPGISQFGL